EESGIFDRDGVLRTELIGDGSINSIVKVLEAKGLKDKLTKNRPVLSSLLNQENWEHRVNSIVDMFATYLRNVRSSE
ncbi:MAG: hypothetical protein O3A77_04105, partial [bacterium]|nr:hypothetical protein [bacterium]